MSDKRQEAIEKYVNEFVSEYQALAEQAEKQVEHTRTAGWQALCKGFKASISSAQAILAEELEQAAKLIKTRGPDDGVIKSIGDVKKRADEVYQTSQHFDTSVLLPIRQAAQRAGDLASRKRQESEQWDANTPLIWNGVRLAMARAINDLPRYVWNPGNWTVERLDAPGDVVPVLEQKVGASVTLPDGAQATVTDVGDVDEDDEGKEMPEDIRTYLDELVTQAEEDYGTAVYMLLAGESTSDPDEGGEFGLDEDHRMEIRDDIVRLATEAGIEVTRPLPAEPSTGDAMVKAPVKKKPKSKK
jgi:hypothetical protein